jgi:hypothetical protein
MYELKERRDAVELVHIILPEVAENHGVPVEALRDVAEKSWGSPLETDRERHAAHFEFVQNEADIRRQASQLAKAIYEANLPHIREWKFWSINWEREIAEAIKEAGISNPALAEAARDQFMTDASRYEKILQSVRNQNA